MTVLLTGKGETLRPRLSCAGTPAVHCQPALGMQDMLSGPAEGNLRFLILFSLWKHIEDGKRL